MEEIINAITLKTADYGENDKMLTLFSLEKGLVCVGAKGVKKDKARLKFTAEPFCFFEMEVCEKNGRKTLKNATCRKSYFRISQNIKAYFCACVMAEFVTVFFTDSPEENLFKDIVFALEGFLKGKTLTVLIKFLLNGLAFAGYGLDFSGCSECGGQIENRVFLNPQASSFLCEGCSDGAIEFRISTYLKLKEIYRTDFSQLSEQETDEVTNCLKLLKRYVYSRSGQKLKSFDFII